MGYGSANILTDDGPTVIFHQPGRRQVAPGQSSAAAGVANVSSLTEVPAQTMVFHLWEDVKFDSSTEISTKYTERNLAVNEYVILRSKTGTIKVKCATGQSINKRVGDALYQDSFFLEQLNGLNGMIGSVVDITTRSGSISAVVTDVQQIDDGQHVMDMNTLKSFTPGQFTNFINHWDATVVVQVSFQEVNTSPGSVILGEFGFPTPDTAVDPGASGSPNGTGGTPIIKRITSAFQPDGRGLTMDVLETMQDVGLAQVLHGDNGLVFRDEFLGAQRIFRNGIFDTNKNPNSIPLELKIGYLFNHDTLTDDQKQAIIGKLTRRSKKFVTGHVAALDLSSAGAPTVYTVVSSLDGQDFQVTVRSQTYTQAQYQNFNLAWTDASNNKFEAVLTPPFLDRAQPVNIGAFGVIKNFVPKDANNPDLMLAIVYSNTQKNSDILSPLIAFNVNPVLIMFLGREVAN